jgi:nucleotide-binding universal stress UspA family protein
VATQRGKRFGIRTKLSRRSNVADTVLRIATPKRADLVAIGLQDRSAVDRLILGTSVTRILNHARAAVLLARAPTSER